MIKTIKTNQIQLIAQFDSFYGSSGSFSADSLRK